MSLLNGAKACWDCCMAQLCLIDVTRHCVAGTENPRCRAYRPKRPQPATWLSWSLQFTRDSHAGGWTDGRRQRRFIDARKPLRDTLTLTHADFGRLLAVKT